MGNCGSLLSPKMKFDPLMHVSTLCGNYEKDNIENDVLRCTDVFSNDTGKLGKAIPSAPFRSRT